MKTIAEKLGISLEEIKALLGKRGFKLSSFTQFRVIKTEGSSEEILEWEDSFSEPLDPSLLESYYQNPELFYRDAVRDMRELFLKVAYFMGEYSRGIVEKKLGEKEAGGALLMALHLFFTTCDIIWKYDRLLETRNPEISPVGRIYQDIRGIVEKLAEAKGYDKAWVEKTSNLLFSAPDYLSPTFRCFCDCSLLMEKYPLLRDVLEEKDKQKILSKIKEQPKIYENLKEIAEKYFCEPFGIVEFLLTLKSSPQIIEIFKKQKKDAEERINKVLQEIRRDLPPEEFEKLEKAREKIKWFMDLQEINEFIISKNRSIDDLKMLIIAVDEYFKENLDSFIKEEYREEIRATLSSLFQKDIPRGSYHFLPALRKLAYQLIKLGYSKNEYQEIYKKELKIWEGNR
jgi:hypothetical protein